jgi:hypothetical protein
MPTEPEIAEIVRAAAEAADPPGADDAVTALITRFEDRDEPVTTVTDELIRLATRAEDVS